jgi:hypothetical protein
MDWWGDWCKSPAADFPNGLSGARPAVLPRRWGMLAVLLVACLVPRAWESWKWDVLSSDTLFYLRATEALERGDYAQAFAELNLNIYPLILLLLRRLDIDWTVTGQWWSVLMASAAVLPLFGWMRRQFDDQVALVGCLLYAAQPTLVAFTPLIIRDPTFWFLMNLSIYLMWRAISEIRCWLFAAAGGALTLAVHTRFEGWLLLVPLALWSAGRLRAAAGARWRLTLATLLCAAMIPLSVTLVNVTWLRDCPQWKLIRDMHGEIAWSWLHSFAAPQVAQAPPGDEFDGGDALQTRQPATRGGAVAAAGDPDVRLSGATLARKLGLRIVKTYSYAFGLLTLLGLWGWRRVYVRLEHQALLLMCVLLTAEIWIRYAEGGIDIRYVLPIVLLSFPWMALGLLWSAEWAVWLTQRWMAWGPRRYAMLVTCLLATAALVGLPSMKLALAPRVRQQAVLGRWVLERLGPDQKIASGFREVPLLAYYARGEAVGVFLPPASALDEPPLVGACRPDVILLWTEPSNYERCAVWAETLDRASGLAYRRVPRGCLPANCDQVIVLVRSDQRF